ncbi:beta-lactamase-like [Gloeomargarita lithophora Alchichica-D10]|uniref:Beta-lactamase-like n=1 Tax=Gloeomargarita lithophora Alchichica-D10 TaxID=1188229 RepID=A0A1J0ACX7_9CYAN|nr:MBL fold metallo-hydrolase [Gloeomargarita lithophora]APB33789.1 beta-lactamase-like [Gloeomargarita lithophora Alchichica-D10]
MTLGCRVYSPGHGGAGVCLVVQVGAYRLMLDCGLSQLDPYFDLEPPADAVVCSHAHPQQGRGLLALHRGFPDLPIYTSGVTQALLPLNWPPEPGLTGLGTVLPWRLPVHLAADLTVELIPAGHLPGAALVWLQHHTPERTFSLLYTGNCFLANTRLTEGLRLEDVGGIRPDVLVLDGTAGTRKYPRRKQQEQQLVETVVWGLTQGQRVWIVAGGIGEAQEILLVLRTHYLLTGRPVKIGVDGVVARGCDSLLELLVFLPEPVQNFARHQSLFWDDRVYPQSYRWQGESPDLFDIMIASTWPDFGLVNPTDWLVLWPEGEPCPLDLPSQTYLLPAHNDGVATLQLIHTLRPQHLVLVHGAPNYLGDMAGLEEIRNRYHVHVPQAGAWLDLPVGLPLVSSPPPEQGGNYEGELAETGSGIRIELPQTLTSDPRWLNFGATGLVEARWQGEELLLRGLSPQEVLAPPPTGARTCAHCRFYRGQRCTQPDSPLMGLQVAPEGYCAAFQSIVP